MIEKIKALFKDKLSREVIVYLIAGAATTLVNLLVFFVAHKVFSATVSTAIAWVVSVIFAYFVNSRFVFLQKPESLKAEIKPFLEFSGARAFSGLIDLVCSNIFIDRLMFNSLVIKILISIFVVVFNYVVSKFWIYKK
ncbi:MAG: GtrA family protein [Clostridia bacterium]|nr:GtrA family protein [Clostridia bacterium]